LNSVNNNGCETTTFCVQAFDWPFTADDLALSFRQFSAAKALATEYVPAVVWKEISLDFA